MGARNRRRRGLWLRWALRDGRRRWPLVVVLGLIIGAGTGTHAALSSMGRWNRESYDASYRLLHGHDLQVTLPAGVLADVGLLAGALQGLPHRDAVAAGEERLVIPTTVDASVAGRVVLVEGRIVGSDVASGGPPVNTIDIVAGRALAPADAGQRRGILEAKFAAFYQLEATGTVRLRGGASVEYVGTGVGPEQFLITGAQGRLQSEATFANVYLPIDAAQQLIGRPGKVNNLVVRLQPGADVGLVQRELTDALNVALPGVATVTAHTEEEVYRFRERDIENDQRFFNVFATIILGGIALAAFNLVNRIVEAQRREIGIGMALGMRRAALARRPLLIGAQVAVIGVVCGIILGLLVSIALRRFLMDFLPLPIWRTGVQADLYLRSSLLAFLLPIAAAGYPVWRAVRVAPAAALRSGTLTPGRGGLVRLLGGGHRRRLTLALPLRAVLRTPRRTFFTAVGIAASLTTLVAVLGAVDTFQRTIARSEEALLGRYPDRLIVQLDGFYPVQAPQVAALAGVPGVGQVEPRVTVPVRLTSSGHEPVEAALASYREGGLWQPRVREAAPAGGQPGIVIAAGAATDLGVRPGDTLTMQLPGRAATGAGTTEAAVRVIGLTENPLRSFAYIEQSQLAALGLAGVANGAQAIPGAGTTAEQLQLALAAQPAVATVAPMSATTRILRDFIDDFSEFLRIIEIVVLPVAVLIAFNAASVAHDERTREHATMIALGMRTRTLVRLAVTEATIIGVLGTMLGLVGGRFAFDWVLRVAHDTMPGLALDRAVFPGTYALIVGVGIVAVGLTPTLLAPRLNRIDVPSAIRVVE